MPDHQDNFAGKSMIITGASRGIGRAIAHHFAALGCHLVLVARSKDQLEHTKKTTTGSGKVIHVAADIADSDQLEQIASLARKEFGGIDYLINNAGQVALGTLAQLSTDQLRSLIRVNVEGFVLLTKAVWNDLAARRGAVLNISSMSAFDPFLGLGAYGATKAFVNFYTRVLADEGAPVGIRAYAIAPGAVETDMLRGAFPEFPAEQTLSPGDIADLAVEILSPPFRYSSGQVVQIQKR